MPGDLLDAIAAPPSAPPVTPPAAATAVPAGAPIRSGAPAGDLLDALAANPDLGAPPPPKEPGSFGAFDPGLEGHIFDGPWDKGLQEGLAQSFGFREANPGWGQMASEIWDNITEGAHATFRELRNSVRTDDLGGTGRAAVNFAAGVATPFSMAGQGLVQMLKAAPQGVGQIADGLQNPGVDAEGVTSSQRIGRGAGTLLGLLANLAMMKEGGKAGAAVDTGKLAEGAEKLAAAPGNALVRANRETNYLFGKNPGRVLVDEPIHPTPSLENLREQVQAAGDRLHAQVNAALQQAATVGGIAKDGTVRRVPNLLDWATEVEDAAAETKRDVQRQSGVGQRAAVVKAINDVRDDILQEHDPEGNATGPKRRVGAPAEINEIKKTVGGRGNYKVFTDPDAAERAAVVDRFVKKVYGKLNELTDNAVGGQPGERIRDLNARYANAIEFRHLLDKRIALENGTGGWNAAVRKGGWGAGIYAVLNGHPLAGAGILTNQALRTTPGRIATARTLGATAAALRSPAVRAAVPAAARGVAAIPAVSAGARQVLAGQEESAP